MYYYITKEKWHKKVDKKRLFFFLNYRFFIYLLRSKHLQDRKRSLKVPKIIFNPQMKRRFGQFCASWYVLSTRSEVLSKFGAFYTTFCRTHDTLIHFWKIGIYCALDLVKIVENAFFLVIPYRHPWIMWKLCNCWAISITICTSNHVHDTYFRSTRSSKNLKKQQLFASLNIFSLNV